MSSSAKLSSPRAGRSAAVRWSPQPTRSLALLRSEHLAPRTPCKKTAEGTSSSTSRDFWFEGSIGVCESSCSAPMILPEWLPAFGQECVCSKPYASSVASTVTPGLDDVIHSPPLSPELSSTSRGADGVGDMLSPIRSMSKGQDLVAPQMRKIFVGGLPKNIDQHQLRLYFSTYGKVQKAWLQHLRHGPAQTTKEHRGFGFVVFSEADSVEKLLGDDLSRFVKLDRGPRVEVKRAVSNCDMEVSKAPALTTYAKRVWETAGRNGVAGSECCELRTRDNDACEKRVACVNRSSASEGVSGTPLAQHFPCVSFIPTDCLSGEFGSGWNCFGNQRCGNACSILPNIPCMPIFLQPSTAQLAISQSEVVLRSPAEYPVVCPSEVVVDSFRPSLLEILLKDFVGKRPCNSAELALVLAQAMPDRYDD